MKLFAPLSFIWLCLALFTSPALSQDPFFDANGVSIRYVDHGKGEAIVLRHVESGELGHARHTAQFGERFSRHCI